MKKKERKNKFSLNTIHKTYFTVLNILISSLNLFYVPIVLLHFIHISKICCNYFFALSINFK